MPSFVLPNAKCPEHPILQVLNRFINLFCVCVSQGSGAGCLCSERNEKCHGGSFFGRKSSVCY